MQARLAVRSSLFDSLKTANSSGGRLTNFIDTKTRSIFKNIILKTAQFSRPRGQGLGISLEASQKHEMSNDQIINRVIFMSKFGD